MDALDFDLTWVGCEEFGDGEMGEGFVSKKFTDVYGEVREGSWVFESESSGRKDEEMRALESEEEKEGRVSAGDYEGTSEV